MGMFLYTCFSVYVLGIWFSKENSGVKLMHILKPFDPIKLPSNFSLISTGQNRKLKDNIS